MRHTLVAVWRDPTGRVGLLLVVFVVALAVVGPFLTPYDPVDTSSDVLLSPGVPHLLGTDQFGRDVLTRMIYGAQVSLLVAVGGCLLALLLGGLLGTLAGYWRGAADEVIMRVMDVAFAFPFLVLAIVLAFVVGSSVPMLILIVAVTRLPQFARLMRGGVLDVLGRDYVATARAVWGGRPAVLWRHVVPNAAPPVIAYASLAVGIGVNIEAALSFLGIGVQPPNPSWGGMLSDGRAYMLDAPWLSIAPGLAILLTVMAFNLLADGMRDALDPTLVTAKSGPRRRRPGILRAALFPPRVRVSTSTEGGST
ncbi:MAG: ABC transporter permease subunit [Micromonosporaceae bacterium]|nr:ABC transporter permease subunit [Micromonosporaceae bacterium]